jgi:REP element-mobilizing transposase RayT
MARPLRKLKTLRRVHVDGAIYFVTASTRRRQPILVNAAADAILLAFARLRDEQRARVLAFVVMPDHVHALLQPPDDVTIGEVLKYFKRISATSIRRLGRTGRLWEARFYDRVMRDEQELGNAVRYIHENPVKANLCGEPFDWLWSTANRSVHSDLKRVLTEWNGPPNPHTGWTPADVEL